jgi:hypothetical protein
MRISRAVLGAAVLTCFAPGALAPASGQIPSTFTNLQVLPKDISRADLVAQMRGVATALGVRCTHCHVGPDNLQGMDFAVDGKPSKVIARTMLRMVRTINAEFVATLPSDNAARQQVTCVTCHRRSLKPPRPLPDLLLSTIDAAGVASAVEQYRTLRSEALDSGLYDFREPTLDIVATRLREAKRFSEALVILRVNAEHFPRSASVQANIGDTAAQAGDVALAREAYRRALEIDPEHAGAKLGLSRLEQK